MIFFLYIQDQIDDCGVMQLETACQDDVKSVDIANFAHFFKRRFEIIGVFNETSIHKALTLIFTYMLRSQYVVNASNGYIYYNILNGFYINGTGSYCTILEIVTDVKVKGLYSMDEVISISSWLDTIENGEVVRFIPSTNDSLCEPTFTEKHSMSYTWTLKDPLTWKGTISFFRFLQKTYPNPTPLCLELVFKTDNRHVQIRCLKHFKMSSKSAKHWLKPKYFEDIILTYTCYGFSCTCLMVAIPLHACTLSWNTVAGKNVQFLMFSFLLSHIAFLFGIQNSNEGLCFWNSVFIQYFFLCDFSWMSVCLIHLTCTLYSLKRGEKSDFWIKCEKPCFFWLLLVLVCLFWL